jgi:hypothetical protein
MILDDITAALIAQNVGQTTSDKGDWMIFQGYTQAEPSRCITLYETVGDPPEEGFAIDYAGVQIKVRGNPDDYRAVRLKLRAIFDALHAQEQNIGPNYVYFYCRNSGPISLGQDELRRPSMAQNYRSMENRTPAQ